MPVDQIVSKVMDGGRVDGAEALELYRHAPTHVLALDQSTSATKALLFTRDGRLIDKESREHKQHYPQAGWVEHDAEEIWQNTLATLRAVITRLGDHGLSTRDLACLSLTNQRETIVLFDRASGKPLHHALVWQDRRGDALCASHIAAGREPSCAVKWTVCARNVVSPWLPPPIAAAMGRHGSDDARRGKVTGGCAPPTRGRSAARCERRRSLPRSVFSSFNEEIAMSLSSLTAAFVVSGLAGGTAQPVPALEIAEAQLRAINHRFVSATVDARFIAR